MTLSFWSFTWPAMSAIDASVWVNSLRKSGIGFVFNEFSPVSASCASGTCG